MKILYVKNNSERAKEFQLKTIIYKENGQKFVKKQALCQEAIPHLKKMKESYEKLTASIIDPKIKLAKIIEENENSLTFEFIEGISLEKKFNDAVKLGEEASNDIIDEYMALLKNGFKTTIFNSSNTVNNDYKKIFGDLDYSKFNDQFCFDENSNIDLIFSNIIFKNNDIYIIDYEWVYNSPLPLKFIMFRTLESIKYPNKQKYFSENELLFFHKMEEYFLFINILPKSSFYYIRNQYLKKRDSFQNIEHTITELSEIVQTKDQQVIELNKLAHDLQKQTCKGRIKTLINKITGTQQ